MNLPLPQDFCNPEMWCFMFARAWFSGPSASWPLTNDSRAEEDQQDLPLVCVMLTCSASSLPEISLQTQI